MQGNGVTEIPCVVNLCNFKCPMFLCLLIWFLYCINSDFSIKLKCIHFVHIFRTIKKKRSVGSTIWFLRVNLEVNFLYYLQLWVVLQGWF